MRVDLVRLSFRLPDTGLHARDYVEVVETGDGAVYDVIYRAEQRGTARWAVLTAVEERMPPRTPQISSYTNADRLPMPDRHTEAAQRRAEWAEVNARAQTETTHG